MSRREIKQKTLRNIKMGGPRPPKLLPESSVLPRVNPNCPSSRESSRRCRRESVKVTNQTCQYMFIGLWGTSKG